jgi:carboxymethylenebutenolidase
MEESYIGAETSWVTYSEGIRGFLAIPQRWSPPYRGIILCHERYGLFKHTLDLAAKFASYGLVCLAPDFACRWDGDKEALARGDTGLTITVDEVRAIMSDSLDFLKDRKEVDANRCAAMGVCMSGWYPWLLNSIRQDVTANICYYGGAKTPAEVYEALTAPSLVVFGEGDHSSSLEAMMNMRHGLEAANKSYDFRIYKGAPHGFLNDVMPGRYRQKEAEDAWALAIDFLDRVDAGYYAGDRVRWRFESEIAPDYDFTKNVRFE